MPSDTNASVTPITIGSRKATTPPAANPAGRMIIDLIATDGGFRHHPVVRFEPVGYFTSGLMERYTLHFCQEIERAQAQARSAQPSAKEPAQ